MKTIIMENSLMMLELIDLANINGARIISPLSCLNLWKEYLMLSRNKPWENDMK